MLKPCVKHYYQWLHSISLQASPNVEACDRPKQTEHPPISRKFQIETSESIMASLIPGEWVSSIYLSDAYLHIPIHANSRKYLESTFFPKFSSVPVLLPFYQPSHGPTSLYNDCKGNKADGPQKGSQTSPIPG